MHAPCIENAGKYKDIQKVEESALELCTNILNENDRKGVDPK